MQHLNGWATEIALLVAPALAAIAAFDLLALHNLALGWVAAGSVATGIGACVVVDYAHLMWRRARVKHNQH